MIILLGVSLLLNLFLVLSLIGLYTYSKISDEVYEDILRNERKNYKFLWDDYQFLMDKERRNR